MEGGCLLLVGFSYGMLRGSKAACSTVDELVSTKNSPKARLQLLLDLLKETEHALNKWICLPARP